MQWERRQIAVAAYLLQQAIGARRLVEMGWSMVGGKSQLLSCPYLLDVRPVLS